MKSNIEQSVVQLNPLATCYEFDASVCNLENDFVDGLRSDSIGVLLKRGRLFSSTSPQRIPKSKLAYYKKKLIEEINRQDLENTDPISYVTKIEEFNVGKERFMKVTVEENKRKKPIYVGLFFTWPSNDNIGSSSPFLYCIGSQKITSALISYYENYLGCIIKPIMFSQHELKWLLSLLLHKMEHTVSKAIEIVYQIDESLLTAKFSLPVGQLKEIWNKIHDEDQGLVTYEEVMRLHIAFQEHIMETHKIDLSYFHVKRFSIPESVTIDMDGKMCITSLDIFDIVARFMASFKK